MPAPIVAAAIVVPPPQPIVAPPASSGGRGLVIGGIVAGGIGLGVQLSRIALGPDACDQIGSLPVTCTEDRRVNGAIGLVGTAFNVTAAALVGLGGRRVGRHAIALDTFHHRKQRKFKDHVIAGAVLLIGGLGGYLAVRVTAYTTGFGTSTCDQLDCVRRLWPGWVVGIAASQGLAVVGAGLLGYGGGYRDGRPKQSARLQLAPLLSREGAGLQLRGAF